MNKTTIFTDGSSRGNPGPGGWGSIIVNKDNVIELGGREENTTNNRMELKACIEALKLCKENESIILYSDSKYVIRGITEWIKNWKINGWITKTKEEVINKDLWEELDNISSNKNISWQYVGGHSGIVGNERCDIIATSYADKIDIELYKGNLSGYFIKNILDINLNKEKVESKTRNKSKAYSYISMIEGEIKIHKTWSECEERVKGKSNAKYKKSISPENEKQIISEFEKSIS